MSEPTLVAMITSLCFLLRASHRPMIVSDSPPTCPLTQREYESAVSIRLKPAPTKASRSLNDVAPSTVHPNTLPPKAIGATSKSVLPSLRLCTRWILATLRALRHARRQQHIPNRASHVGFDARFAYYQVAEGIAASSSGGRF